MNEDKAWSKVEGALIGAKAITWDGCHKIYVLMDEAQVDEMVRYGYDPIIRASAYGTGALLDMLKEWYEASCSLRFISAVKTVKGDSNDGFTALISQFDDEEDED